MTKRVLHLVGSAESDFFADLSRLYAADCLRETADPALYDHAIAYVAPDSSWRFPADLSAAAIDAAPPLGLAAAIERIEAMAPALMVPQMFCIPGMTLYRSLFDTLGVPYLGNRGELMALAADKAKARAIVAAAGVRVPQGELLGRGELPSFAPPYVIKPVDADNSSGVSLVRDPAEVEPAIERALGAGTAALAERYIELGREVRCGLIVRDGELLALPLEEYGLDAGDHPIRGVADKLSRSDGNGELSLVAKDAPGVWIVDREDPVTEPVQEAARLCHAALGCRDHSLFDFRIDRDGMPWFLEAGLYCSFAHGSVIAAMARAAGIDTAELFAIAIAESESRRGVDR